MPHNHVHGGCNDECADDHHDHDHGEEGSGPRDNLYAYIDVKNVAVLNVEQEDDVAASSVIKPWHERKNEEKWVQSDADDQIIIRIPFTGSVKLRSLLLKCGPGDQTPEKVHIFANEESLDFSDTSEKQPVQSLDIATGRDVGEYYLKPAKFSNVSSIALFFPTSQGADNIRIYFIGLLGVWSERKREAVITVYESQANLADHEKIQGTDGGLNSMQFGA